jgi:hypothetical protein
MFWLPPHHNQQRDRRERSDSCCFVPLLSFEQKTSLFDSAFSRRVASKLGDFHLHHADREALSMDWESQ